MAFSVNKAILVGNLGQDAEVRTTQSNLEITRFSLATTRSWKNKDGEWQNETTWHNIVAFNLSDYYKEQLKKGKKFYIEGRISKNEYTDKEGVKRYSSEIIAENLVPLDSKESSGSSAGSSVKYQGVNDTSSPFSSAPSSGSSSDPDNDLPF
jgi:single-strand DNA-binding protein